MDQTLTRVWERDTIVNVWSITKGLCAMCAHRLADHGQLDFETPVAKYWPEFAQAGKGMIPVSFLLNHKAGLAALRAPPRHEELPGCDEVTPQLAREGPGGGRRTRHAFTTRTLRGGVGEAGRRINAAK